MAWREIEIMKRYRHLNSPCCRTYGWLAEKPDGEWMRFEDHQAAIAAKDAEIARMRAQLALAEKTLQEPHPDAARLDKLPQCFHMLRTGPVNGCDEWWLTYDTSKGYASVREAIDAHKGTPE